MSKEESQILNFSVPVGVIVELTNGASAPKRYRFECGDYGFIEVDLPIGGKVRFKPRTIVPYIIMDDVEAQVFEGDNVVRIKDED